MDAASNDDYEKALDYLYSFINFEHRPSDRYMASKIDAERPRRLLALLDDPHKTYPSIHIAGTKGKGSVAAMAASSLCAAGLRVGLYTSPHLRDIRERIRVLSPNDPEGLISRPAFVALVEELRPTIDSVDEITWYEIMTAAAFVHFRDEAINVAVVEVGLGGRLDATNVLTPEVSVITRLSLDHTELLGDTLPQIAFEKGGIIKPGVPVVLAPQRQEAMTTLEALCNERGSNAIVVGRDWQYEGYAQASATSALRTLVIVQSPDPEFIPPGSEFPLALGGEYQLENATVALAALEQVHDRFPVLGLAAMQAGLATVNWPGRLQVLQSGPGLPTILLDSAHNPDSAGRLAEALDNDFEYQRLILTFGAPADKDIDGMLDILLPLADDFIVTAADHPRAADPDDLAERSAQRGRTAIVAGNTANALAKALETAEADDLIVVTGSIILLGDWLNCWDDLQSATDAHG